MTTERVDRRTRLAWQAMRSKLWPGEPLELEAKPEDDLLLTLIARDETHQPVGFAEASIRRDYVNGCDTSPVVFLEGIYVEPEYRRRGVARELVDAVADWGRARGCGEFASDAPIDNLESHAMHAALGFEETERVVYFKKPLKKR